ncbi:hypothetical protein EDB81DRAFT_852368 [Dactylonectria macrodidyma]|uniref:Uncharacterized protein n=1 Tax=Dactylonectria macrodidyma TaxID=307937 RepID=A0A9P9JME0_9HYPO|nr:hypothetical protein EDB81DRAFT_852368 [Dactylonectria macrodidyma]
MSATASTAIDLLDADDHLPTESPTGSFRSSSTCLQPPASLLVEQSPPSPVNPIRAVDTKKGRQVLGSSPLSPTQRPSEPWALQPSFMRLQPSHSSFATTVASQTAPSRPTTAKGDISVTISRNHFRGPRPIGDPSLARPQPFRLEFPPPSRDQYPISSKNLFQSLNTANSIDVEELLDKYSEEGAQLVEFLAGQEQDREASYKPVVEARNKADNVLREFLCENRKKSQAARLAERRARGLVQSRRTSSPPPLTPAQVEKIRHLETDLVKKMEAVSINHGETEGVIAGFFTFKCDGVDKEPPESYRELLLESGGLDKRLFRKPLVAHPELGEMAYLQGMSKPARYSAYQGRLDDIRSANRDAFNQAFWVQWQQASAPPPESEVKTVPASNPDSSPSEPTPEPEAKTFDVRDLNSSPSSQRAVLIPEWFPIFKSYKLFDLWPGSAGFTQLLNIIHDLEMQCKFAPTQPKRWDKEWHDASSLWNTAVRKQSGG